MSEANNVVLRFITVVQNDRRAVRGAQNERGTRPGAALVARKVSVGSMTG